MIFERGTGRLRKKLDFANETAQESTTSNAIVVLAIDGNYTLVITTASAVITITPFLG